MDRQKLKKHLLYLQTFGFGWWSLIRLYLSELNAVASNPIRSGACTTWRYQQVKNQPSAKKMVKLKQMITIVSLFGAKRRFFTLEWRFLMRGCRWGARAYRGARSAVGSWTSAARSCKRPLHSQRVFTFFVYYPSLTLRLVDSFPWEGRRYYLLPTNNTNPEKSAIFGAPKGRHS